jgi:hypothetical protein
MGGRVMAKALTSKYTAKTILAELKELARIHRRARQGYREVLRDLMGRAGRILDRIDNNDKLRRKFVLMINRQSPQPGGATQSSLSTEVMAIIIGARSRSARQRAWKYGRVLDVLLSAGVSVDAIAKEIKKRGGIERIYQDSIDKRSGHRDRAKTKSRLRPFAAKHRPPPETDIDAPKTNNTEVLVGVYMKLADRDAILDNVSFGKEVWLKAMRIAQPKAELKIRSIKIIR